MPENLPERIRKYKTSGVAQSNEVCGQLFAELLMDDELPSLDELANCYSEFVLRRLGGNKRQTAQLLDISRATLYLRLGIATENG